MKISSYNLKIILLGAGKSERFESIKLLAKVRKQNNSILIIQHVLQQISASLEALKINKSNLYVATGRYHEQISECIGKQFIVDYCANAHLGLGHTIAQSVESIISNDDNTSHIMVTLADQVALTIDDYVRLIDQSISMPDKLICAKSGHEIMSPAIFPRYCFTDLMSLKGDKGAKIILHKYKESLQELILPNAAIDIDTQQDLTNWYKRQPQI